MQCNIVAYFIGWLQHPFSIYNKNNKNNKNIFNKKIDIVFYFYTFARNNQVMSEETAIQTFTKEQAIEKMQQGFLLTHPLFEEGEWISSRFGQIIDECGFDLGSINGSFWKYRTQESWNTGWITTK